MVLVRGNDTYSGIEIAPEPAWGTKAVVNWERVHPLLEESFTVEMTPLPQPKHFGQGGQPVDTYDIGRQLVRGSFTIYPSYNAKFMHYLLGQGHGGVEVVVADTGPATNATTITNCGTHVYFPASYRTTTAGSVSGVGNGFTVRAWKAGPSATGYVDTFTGCIVSKITINQPDEDRPTWTFEFIGYALSTAAILTGGAGVAPMTHAASFASAINSSTGWTSAAEALNNNGVLATTTTLNSIIDVDTFGTHSAKINVNGAIGSVVQSVQVSLDAKKTDSGGTSTLQFYVYLSNDDGATWSTANSTGNLTANEAQYTVDAGGNPPWGLGSVSIAQWLAQTRVQIKAVGTVVGTPTWHLEGIIVTLKVYDMDLRIPQTNMVTVGMRDYKGRPTHGTLPGVVSIGQNTGSAHSLIPINTRGFSITIDPHLDVPPPFLNDFDTVDKPAHTDLWECTGTIRSMLEQDYGAANRPATMMANKQDGCIRIRYVSASTDIPSSSPAVGYAMDLFFPCVVWTGVKNSYDDVIPTTEWNFTTYKDAYGVQNTESAITAAVGTSWPAQWVIQLANAYTTAVGYSTTPEGEEESALGDLDETPPTPVVVRGSVLTVAPTANDADAAWTTPNNAHADGGGNATSVTLDSALTFTTFDVSTIPAGAEIMMIAVILDGKYDDAAGSGTLEFGVQLSWDAGTSWTTEYRTSLTTTEDTLWVSGDGFFGRAWTRAELDSLRVRVKARGSAIVDDPEWQLDFVRVRISYIGQVI